MLPSLISIIVPVYNEAGTVRQVIERLLQIPLPAAREIIVVNDGSTDGTREVLDGIAPVDGVLSIVHAAANGGKGSAHPHRPRARARHDRRHSGRRPRARSVQLGGLVQPILDGEADVVYGSRFLAGRPPGPGSRSRRTAALTWLTNVLFGGRLTDMETCYKIMAAPVARSLQLESNRFDIEPEITAKLLRQRLPHRRAAGDVRSAQPRERQENRLARRRSRDRRAAEIQIPVIQQEFRRSGEVPF